MTILASLGGPFGLLRRRIRKEKNGHRRRLEDQLQQNNIGCVWSRLKIWGYKKPTSKPEGDKMTLTNSTVDLISHLPHPPVESQML